MKMLEYETASPGKDSTKDTEAQRAKELGEIEEGRRANGMASTSGTGSSKREMLPMRRPAEAPNGFANFEKQAPGVTNNSDSNRPWLESPAMGSADVAFHGLAPGGMHADEAKLSPVVIT
jgi:hypothetical protein